jgi:multidrug resistance efflux pump
MESGSAGARLAPSVRDLDRARRDLATDLERVRARARHLDRAAALIEEATADGLRAATSDGERAETLLASALHARRLAAA